MNLTIHMYLNDIGTAGTFCKVLAVFVFYTFFSETLEQLTSLFITHSFFNHSFCHDFFCYLC